MLTLYPLDGRDMYRLKAAKYRSDVDPRELATYTAADVARYLGIHPTTLRYWMHGRENKLSYFDPIITPADPVNDLLSFYNLAEAHVLASTRYHHHVGFPAIRAALDTLKKKYPSEHPLISQDFFTNGKDLFLKTINENENLSRPGMMNFKPIMDMFLRHIDRDDDNLVKRIFPIIKGQPHDKVVFISHGIASGQPVVGTRAVPVFIIYGRHKAGEKNKSIANDFGIAETKVQRAIDYVEKRDLLHEERAS